MIHVVISTQVRHPCPAGEYHYSKLLKAEILKEALENSPDCGHILDLIDPDQDIVGFDVVASSVDGVRSIVDQVFGQHHGLRVYNPYARNLGVSPAP